MTDLIKYNSNQPYHEEPVKPWVILITDDSHTVHEATEFALRDKVIHGKPIQFLHAFTGREASNLILTNNNIDLMLLDAMMETPTAGIDCARFIKIELKRKIPTIIMRTGFAGWEVEMDMDNLSCIDDFILKSNASQRALIDMLEKWLPY